MDPLQSVVAFWRDCLKSENALEQNFGVNRSSFGLTARTKAMLFEGQKDPFIFAERGFEYSVESDKTHELASRSRLRGDEIYFGYPLLLYFDDKARRNCVAPLFVIRLELDEHDGKPILARAESIPTLGSCAFEKLGLKQEEIVALNGDVAQIFEANKSSKLTRILSLIKKETDLTLAEDIDPNSLSTKTDIEAYAGTAVHNKAVLFASEASVYNLHLLNDLEQLVKRPRLNDTSLRYITSPVTNSYADFVPVLPFAFDEYQLRAIQHILGSEHTVVTGPPGTGKSQFIANLIVNLFLQKKKVLFVSHTGEAVRVVNERVNREFSNLMMQTGRKEIRQELGIRLSEMVDRYNEQPVSENTATFDDIRKNWQDILDETAYFQETMKLNKKLEDAVAARQRLARKAGLLNKVRLLLVQLKVGQLAKELSVRRDSNSVLAHVDALRNNHVEVSRQYVKGSYLASILGGGLYGRLLAYIESVQSRKFNFRDSEDKSERYIDDALGAMNVWSCTLKSLAATFPLRPNLFDYVIFDEASQIDLPSAAPALYRARRVVVVGDENQLTHIAKINPQLENELAEKYHIAKYDFYPALVSYNEASLFNSAKRSLSEPEQELKNHYRSNALIANLFSSIFYAGKLRVHEPDVELPQGFKSGVYWIDVKGTAQKYKTGSRFNSDEIHGTVKLLEKLLPMASANGLTIGITTPYSRQRQMIADEIERAFGNSLQNVKVLTVHQFQGSEVDILIFSTVLANKGDGNSDYWYARNRQILNVAISRAKHLLLIIGDLKFSLHSKSKLKDIAEHCEHLNGPTAHQTPNRPMNIFEKQLLTLLKKHASAIWRIEPQYVLDSRFTLDFALFGDNRKIAIELDGAQHEIVGGLVVFEDKQRNKYLSRQGWQIIRISVHELIGSPDKVVEMVQAVLGEPTKLDDAP